MTSEQKQHIKELLEEVKSKLQGQELEQPDAEDLWVELKQIEMTLRANILPIKITSV